MITLDHPWRAAGQREVFRHLLDAMARPGSRHDLSPWAGGSALLAVLACLVDAHTTLHDRDGLLSELDASRLGAGRADAGVARFILARGARVPGDLAPDRGTLLQPERGATVVLAVDYLDGGAPLHLRGPGIDGSATMAPRGLDPAWITARAGWCAHPLGVDYILVDAGRVTCIPRTTAVEA